MKILNDEQKEICKKCFEYFVDTKNVYKPSYNILKYTISRRQFLLYSEIYYNMLANIEEKSLYDNIIKTKKNNKFEQLKNKYREAFIKYIKNEDTEEYYDEVAISSRISVATAKRYPMHYYDKYATDKERQIFDKIRIQKKNQTLEQKEKQTKEKYKDIFDVCVKSDFDDNQINNLTEKYSVSSKTIKNYTNNYYDKYATSDEKNKCDEAKIKHRENNARYVKIFNHILNMDKMEDILLYLINQKNLNRTYLKTSINPYVISYPETDVNKLNKIIDVYYSYIDHRNKKEDAIKLKKEEENIRKTQAKKNISDKMLKQKQTIMDLIKIIEDYNESSNLDYRIYCKEKNISIKKFTIALKITAKFDKKNYLKFIEKLRKYNQKLYNKETQIIFRIIIEIRNNEKFGIIDYYNITKINLNELNIIAKKVCTKTDYVIFNEFYEKYKNDELVNPSLLIKASYLINSYGNQVELDRKQKIKIINSLVKEDIPITKYTYLEMIKKELEEKPKQKQKVA